MGNGNVSYFAGHGTLFTSDNTGIIFSESLLNHLYPNFQDLTDFYKVMINPYSTDRENMYCSQVLLALTTNSFCSCPKAFNVIFVGS